MTPGIVQLHLTRRCNLSCLHCYSGSGPEQRDQLDLENLFELLAWAKGMGYSKLSLSGGEPLLYPDLWDLLDHATSDGWMISAITNGAPLGARTAERAARYLSVVGVSLDGREELHNRIRNADSAFRWAVDGMARLRAAGIPFAVVHTLSRSSLPDLCWLLDFAREQGAAGLRLHPLEPLGHGSELDGEGLDPEAWTWAYLWVTARRCELADDAFRLEVDLVNAHRLRALYDLAPNAPFGDVVSPLVVEPDGAIVPFTYGLARQWQLGSLASLDAIDAASWRQRALDLIDRSIERATKSEWPFLPWFELMAEEARSRFPEAGTCPTPSAAARSSVSVA